MFPLFVQPSRTRQRLNEDNIWTRRPLLSTDIFLRSDGDGALTVWTRRQLLPRAIKECRGFAFLLRPARISEHLGTATAAAGRLPNVRTSDSKNTSETGVIYLMLFFLFLVERASGRLISAIICLCAQIKQIQKMPSGLWSSIHHSDTCSVGDAISGSFVSPPVWCWLAICTLRSLVQFLCGPLHILPASVWVPSSLPTSSQSPMMSKDAVEDFELPPCLKDCGC